MNPIERILVPVDFSPCSRLALQYGIDMAQRFGASLTTLHVYEPPHYVGDVMVQLPEKSSVTVHEYVRRQSAQLLDELIDTTAGLDDVAFDRRLVSGVPHIAIVDAARDMKADLVIMGTHGRSGLSHLLMGSVVEKVLRQAPCPVLVVRDAYPEKSR